MVHNPSIGYPDDELLLDHLDRVTESVMTMDALEAARNLFGDTAAANFLVVGAAYQQGWLPIPGESIEEAIGINGVSVEVNVAAFRWGRAAVAVPGEFAAAAHPPADRQVDEVRVPSLDSAQLEGDLLELVRRRAEELTHYQNLGTSERYVALVSVAARAERSVSEDTRFSEAVARNLFKLMAYKDEYEVARLLTSPEFVNSVRTQFPTGSKLTYKLHPPTLRALGRRKKLSFGPRTHVILRGLVRLRILRGTRLDPFGYARLRRIERALVAHYSELVRQQARLLTPDRYDDAVALVELPASIRGYEHIKFEAVRQYAGALAARGVRDRRLDRLLRQGCDEGVRGQRHDRALAEQVETPGMTCASPTSSAPSL
jgi:indolepyruvate ferredoxin oxidoreductase